MNENDETPRGDAAPASEPTADYGFHHRDGRVSDFDLSNWPSASPNVEADPPGYASPTPAAPMAASASRSKLPLVVGTAAIALLVVVVAVVVKPFDGNEKGGSRISAANAADIGPVGAAPAGFDANALRDKAIGARDAAMNVRCDESGSDGTVHTVVVEKGDLPGFKKPGMVRGSQEYKPGSMMKKYLPHDMAEYVEFSFEKTIESIKPTQYQKRGDSPWYRMPDQSAALAAFGLLCPGVFIESGNTSFDLGSDEPHRSDFTATGARKINGLQTIGIQAEGETSTVLWIAADGRLLMYEGSEDGLTMQGLVSYPDKATLTAPKSAGDAPKEWYEGGDGPFGSSSGQTSDAVEETDEVTSDEFDDEDFYDDEDEPATPRATTAPRPPGPAPESSSTAKQALTDSLIVAKQYLAENGDYTGLTSAGMATRERRYDYIAGAAITAVNQARDGKRTVAVQAQANSVRMWARDNAGCFLLEDHMQNGTTYGQLAGDCPAAGFPAYGRSWT